MTAAEFGVWCAQNALGSFGSYEDLLANVGGEYRERTARQYGLLYKAKAIVYHDRVLTNSPRDSKWWRKC